MSASKAPHGAHPMPGPHGDDPASFHQALLEAVPLSLVYLDDDYRYLYANQSYARLTGLVVAEVLGRSLSEVIGENAFARALPYFRRARAGETVSFRNAVHYPGRPPVQVTLQVTVAPHPVGAGTLLGFLVTLADVTAEQQMELERRALRDRIDLFTRQLVAQETVFAVAHDLNQPLYSAGALCAAAGRMLDKQYPLHQVAGTIARANEALRRASASIDRLVDAYRDMERVAPLVESDLNHICCLALDQHYSGKLFPGQAVQMALAPEPLPVRVSALAIERVILNLLRNAAEAVGQADEAQTEAQTEARAGAPLLAVTSHRQGGFARLCVVDGGPGVPPAQQAGLFEPLEYSDKPLGQGVGLSICRKLIERHDGRIWHEPRAQGSAFCFELPLAS